MDHPLSHTHQIVWDATMTVTHGQVVWRNGKMKWDVDEVNAKAEDKKPDHFDAESGLRHRRFSYIAVRARRSRPVPVVVVVVVVQVAGRACRSRRPHAQPLRRTMITLFFHRFQIIMNFFFFGTSFNTWADSKNQIKVSMSFRRPQQTFVVGHNVTLDCCCCCCCCWDGYRWWWCLCLLSTVATNETLKNGEENKDFIVTSLFLSLFVVKKIFHFIWITYFTISILSFRFYVRACVNVSACCVVTRCVRVCTCMCVCVCVCVCVCACVNFQLKDVILKVSLAI